ncbi:MAG TPA: phytanoyl-CoA dioxygenase family protein, partial [Polyangiaceae bacterium]
ELEMTTAVTMNSKANGKAKTVSVEQAGLDVDALPLTTRFTLGAEITPIQRAFLAKHGFLVFANVASQREVDMITSELDRIQKEWIDEKRTSVYGIPLFWGKNVKKPFLQRFPFTSVFSEKIKSFVRDDRFAPIRDLVGTGARVGDREKDGVVVNRYINAPGSAYPKLGWHTDGLRDIFYLRMPKEMLNIGLHLDHCDAANGGLRLIPGSHKQGLFGMCFGKIYYSNRPDPKEVVVETEPGDLTVHDGRLWHRVEMSSRKGQASLRRSMYVPYLTDEFQPKDDASKTPLYHYLGAAIRKIRSWRDR